jgi:flotillin
VAGNVPAVMTKLFETMKETTGLDLANIINADSYDAKVNRNINLSGLDNLNVTVDAKQNSNQNVNINERE